MSIHGLVITLSDAELSTQQSERVLPALASLFGTDATTEVATSGRYHVWRLTYTIEAPTMLEAAEGVIRMARQARDAAGIHPGQAVGFSSGLDWLWVVLAVLLDLSHYANSYERRGTVSAGIGRNPSPPTASPPTNR